MAEDVSIRLARREDYDQWLALFDGYNAFYGRSGATALSPDITAMTWARFFDAYEPVHALVADSGAGLIPTALTIDRRAPTSAYRLR